MNLECNEQAGFSVLLKFIVKKVLYFKIVTGGTFLSLLLTMVTGRTFFVGNHRKRNIRFIVIFAHF